MEFSDEVLALLLGDRLTGKNIYMANGGGIGEEEFYRPVTLEETKQFKHRWEKSREEQKARRQNKAEVYTPYACVKKMTDLFWSDPEVRKISATYLEITCGEAPFITTLRDMQDGRYVPVEERVGILDRKLAIADSISKTDDDFLPSAFLALTSCYGYDYQGDNLFFARCNVLTCFLEAYERRYTQPAPDEVIDKAADIICWNFWQMDGLSECLPMYGKNGAELWKCKTKKAKEEWLRGLTPCIIKDWQTGEIGKFMDVGQYDGEPRQRPLL